MRSKILICLHGTHAISVGLLGQTYSSTDLAAWIASYRPDAAGYSITVNVSNGGANTGLPGLEAALDTQTVAGIIYPLPSSESSVTFLYPVRELMILSSSFLQYWDQRHYWRLVLAHFPELHQLEGCSPSRTKLFRSASSSLTNWAIFLYFQVITISYGSEESVFTLAQATTMCNAAQQLSALGTTIVVSFVTDNIISLPGRCVCLY